MKQNGTVTIREVYSLIEDGKKEIMSEIVELRRTFQEFEAGRLTRLEVDHAAFKTRVYTIGGTLTVLIGVVEFALNYLK